VDLLVGITYPAFVSRGSQIYFDHLVRCFSLVDHPNIKRIILRILNELEIKFSQQLHPEDF
jgi:hypothetical protein